MSFKDGKGSMGWFFSNGKNNFATNPFGWGCRAMGFRVHMEVNNIDVGSTDRFMGDRNSIGLANKDNDRCGQGANNYITSHAKQAQHGWHRIDGATTDNSIRHLISYSDAATGYSASRCTYCCWGCGSWSEFVMWGVRPME